MTPSVESDTNNQSNNDDAAASVGKCPVDPKNRSLWNVLGINNKEDQVKPEHEVIPGVDPTKPIRIPASVEEAAKYAQTPQPDQRLPLSTHRAMSTIPRGSSKEGEEDNPHHQAGSQSPTWVYPSEQQVFNAMKRKGWQGIEEESIPSFLQIVSFLLLVIFHSCLFRFQKQKKCTINALCHNTLLILVFITDLYF